MIVYWGSVKNSIHLEPNPGPLHVFQLWGHAGGWSAEHYHMEKRVLIFSGW